MRSGLLTWHERGQLWLRLGIRAALAVAVVLLLIFVGLPVLSLMSPFVLALLLAWLLNPLVRWLQARIPASRKVISFVLLLLGFGALGGLCYGLGWALAGQIRSLFDNSGSIIESIYATVNAVGNWLRQLGDGLPDSMVVTGDELVDELVDALTEWLTSLDLSSQIGSLAGRATNLMSAVPGVALATVVFIMASYFIISDYPRMRYQAAEQLPMPLRRFCAQIRDIFMKAFGGYLKSQLLLSLGVFGILAVGFLVTGQPYGLLLAFGLAVMDFIPIIGAGTVMVPWAVIDVITLHYREAIELMVIWGIIVLFRRVAEPKILGNQTGLSPILSLVGIYAGMQLGGVLGMVLGPVLLLVFLNLVKLGIFRPILSDLRAAARDVSAILHAHGPREEREDTGAE